MIAKHDIDDIIDSKISIHDSRHFEIKLDIDLPGSRTSTYEIETYFFVPKALNISSGNYTQGDFYSGVQNYIRFKTPQIPLDRIMDESVPTSPWNRIKAGFDALLQNSITQSNIDRLAHDTVEEIKLLGQVIRASLRDTTLAIVAEIKILRDYPDSSERHESLCASIRRLIAQLGSLGDAISNLRQELSRPQLPSKVKDAYRFFDEFHSITVEEDIARLYAEFQRAAGLEHHFQELRPGLEELLIRQQKHREAMKYPSLIRKGEDNSILPYRKGVLKKFTSSSLYLSLEPTEWQMTAQLNFSIAAGLAMLFAAVVTVFAQSRFSTSSSMFVMIVVVSYILKDRMKDWVKIFLAKRMLRGVADRKIKIRDLSTQQVVGVSREAFAFVEPSRVPDAVRTRRNIDNITSLDDEGKPERIMKFEKEVTLYSKKISRLHQRRRDINDIMRFDVSQWVKHADDPESKAFHFNRETRTMESVTCQKVYHLNMVIRYQSPGADGKMRDTLERVRLILNRDGIVQLEEVR
ncbi:MAG: hypothetical protein NDJ90_07980 [Oligoflexia bacterium]|nr:hypothetical protein [Oligoflexia bacterium]